jgi:hypothetical protein
MPHVTLAGDRDGDYLIAEERPDGSLVLLPDTSVDAMLDRMGARRATLEEFEAEHGKLRPPDDEG